MASNTTAGPKFPPVRFGHTVGYRDGTDQWGQPHGRMELLSWIEVFPQDRNLRIIKDADIDAAIVCIKDAILWEQKAHSTSLETAHEFAEERFQNVPKLDYESVPATSSQDRDEAEKAKKKYLTKLLFDWFSRTCTVRYPTVAEYTDRISPRLDHTRLLGTRVFMQAYLCWLWRSRNEGWNERLVTFYVNIHRNYWSPETLEYSIANMKSGILFRDLPINHAALINEIVSAIKGVEVEEKTATDRLNLLLKLFLVVYFLQPSRRDEINEALKSQMAARSKIATHLQSLIDGMKVGGFEVIEKEQVALSEASRFCGATQAEESANV